MKIRRFVVVSMVVCGVAFASQDASALSVGLCLTINATCDGQANPACTSNSDCLLAPLTTCDTVHGRCVVPCASDLVEVNLPPLACSDPARPACHLNGLLSGNCTECSATNLSVCLLYPDRPACVTASGLCGCNDNSECGGGTCNEVTHRCEGGSSSGGASSSGGSSSGGSSGSSGGGSSGGSSGGGSSGAGVGPSSAGNGSANGELTPGVGLIADGTEGDGSGGAVVEGGACTFAPSQRVAWSFVEVLGLAVTALAVRRRRRV